MDLQKSPRRIISVVPSQTELLVSLGLRDRLVGITRFCVHPPELRSSIHSVGGTKDLRLDRIRQLEPDLIIANKEENEQSQINELAKNYPVWISDVSDLYTALNMISSLGDLLGAEKASRKLIEEISSGFKDFETTFATAIYFIWRDPYMIAGKGTFIDFMMEQMGLENLMKQERYPKIEQAELKSYDPDFVLLSSEPYPFKAGHAEEFRNILPKAQVLQVDGEMFSWYGSRLLFSASYLKELSGQLKLRLNRK